MARTNADVPATVPDQGDDSRLSLRDWLSAGAILAAYAGGAVVAVTGLAADALWRLVRARPVESALVGTGALVGYVAARRQLRPRAEP
jgi:hypothetical protein